MRTWMRWSVGIAAVGLGLVPMTGRAQETEKREETEKVWRTLVLAQPSLGAFVPAAQLGVGVEHAVGSHVSLLAAVQLSGLLTYNEPSVPGSRGSSTQVWGVGVEPGVHFYFAGRAPEGFWVGPHLELSTQHQSIRSETLSFPDGELMTFDWRSRTVSYGGSLRLGYTAILSPGLTFQVGAGLAAVNNRSTPFGEQGMGGGLGGLVGNGRGWSVAPRMTVALGWAF